MQTEILKEQSKSTSVLPRKRLSNLTKEINERNTEWLKSRALDIFFILALLAVTGIISYYRIMIQYKPGRGPEFDGLAFLSNALRMAGISSYFEVGRPPFLPFLLSLFFRIGFVNETVAYLNDAFFYIISAIGLYLILRRRFSPVLSSLGSLILISTPEMIANVGFVGSDIMALSISIWLIYFTILAEKKPKFLLLVFPMLIFAFLTRYTAAVMIFPVIFFLFLKINPLRYLVNYLQSFSIAFAVIFIDVVYYTQITGGQALAQFLVPFSIASTTEKLPGNVIATATQSKYFFVTEMPGFFSLSKAGLMLSAVFAIGFFTFMGMLIKARKKSLLFTVISSLAIFLFMTFLIFSEMNFLLINILFLFIFIIIFPAIFDLNDALFLDIVIFLWFITFFNYHTHQFTKTSRYFITMTPQTSYFIILALSSIIMGLKKLLKKNWNQGKFVFYPAVVLLISTLTFLTGASAYQSYKDISKKKWGIDEQVKAASNWLRPKLKPGSVVYSDYFVGVAWNLRKPVKVMPAFSDEKAFYHEIEKSKADYFVSINVPMKDTPYFKVIKKFNGVYIYGRTKIKFVKTKPSFFFVGHDIDHYLEDILDYKYYMYRKKYRFSDDWSSSYGISYLDDYTLKELDKYPLIVLYDFRWRNIGDAENLIKEYVRRGGTVIIDASGNSGKSFYDLNNYTFLDVSISKKSLDSIPKINVKRGFGLEKNFDASKIGLFKDEFDMPWSGSTYKKIVESQQNFEPIVRADGKTLFGLQRIGKGKVVWIGFNFIFHSFYHKNKQEKTLIKNVFNYAVKSSD